MFVPGDNPGNLRGFFVALRYRASKHVSIVNEANAIFLTISP